MSGDEDPSLTAERKRQRKLALRAQKVDELARESFQAKLDLGVAKTEWYKHIVTLASGALVVLAGFRPYELGSPTEAYLMASTWVLLAVGITAGAVAGYYKTLLYEVQHIVSIWKVMQESNDFSPETDELQRDHAKIERNEKRLKKVQLVMFISLLLAMITFCAYSVVWAFSVESPVVNASQAVIADHLSEQE